MGRAPAERAAQPRVQGRFAPLPLDHLPAALPDSTRRRGGWRRLPLEHPARLDAFLELLRHGAPRSTAARGVGWSAESVEKWIARGRGAAGPARPPTRRYVEFARAVDQAEAQGEIWALGLVARAAAHNWRAGAFLLTRRYGYAWGPSGKRMAPEPMDSPVDRRYVYVDAVTLELVTPPAAAAAPSGDGSGAVR